MALKFKSVLLGLLIWASVLVALSPHKIVQTLEEVLRRDIMNPKDSNGLYIRIIPASPEETAKGKLQLVEFESKPVRVKNIFLRELKAKAVEPTIDVAALIERGKLRTVSVKESNLQGVMDAENLEKMLAELNATKKMKIKVQVTEDDKIVLRGILTLLRINNPFEAICRPETKNDSLHLQIEELRVNGIGAPAFLRSRLEREINPVVEPKDLPFNPPIKSVQIHRGLIYLNMSPSN